MKKCPCGKTAYCFGVCSPECAHKYLDPKPPIFNLKKIDLRGKITVSGGGGGSWQHIGSVINTKNPADEM